MVTKAFLPLLRQYKPKDRTSRLVFISTSGILVSNPFIGTYGASKAAIGVLAGSLRLELASWGFDVSVVIPGPVATPILSDFDDNEVDTLLKQLKPGLHEEEVLGTYERLMRDFTKKTRVLFGYIAKKPEASTRVIESCLLARRPKTEYDVGEFVMVVRFLSLLPVRLTDWLNSL